MIVVLQLRVACHTSSKSSVAFRCVFTAFDNLWQNSYTLFYIGLRAEFETQTFSFVLQHLMTLLQNSRDSSKLLTNYMIAKTSLASFRQHHILHKNTHMHAACNLKNLLFFCFEETHEELSMQTKPQLSLLFLSTFDLIFVVPSFLFLPHQSCCYCGEK